jgi:hypothetical protein
MRKHSVLVITLVMVGTLLICWEVLRQWRAVSVRWATVYRNIREWNSAINTVAWITWIDPISEQLLANTARVQLQKGNDRTAFEILCEASEESQSSESLGELLAMALLLDQQ